MDLCFGITMRITNATGYDETRDTIAQDWSAYMDEAFPESRYVFIPNSGSNAINFVTKWDINVLILTGGDDLGVTPHRDLTETCLLKHAIDNNVPVIAICRGLQLVHSHFGGKLTEGNAEFVTTHRAKPHTIEIKGVEKWVNSYHTNMLNEETIPKGFSIIGRCKSDNSIEAIEYKNILAMMWHPERDDAICQWNLELIKSFIRKIHGHNRSIINR